MDVFKPELVAPAGNWSCLKTALSHGADSIYFGVKSLSMRNFAENFNSNELPGVMELVHSKGKKGYLALNVMVKTSELLKIQTVFRIAKKACVDGVIVWDLGVLRLAREEGLSIHLSTQASVANVGALEFYVNAGVKRIVLARECTLEDIKSIIEYLKLKKSNCEIEIFIHGAMCISISGRCFLSSFSFGKSANRGECLQPCRREYVIHEMQDNLQYVLGKDYILSSKDLCTLNFLDVLVLTGVHAVKIEGRNRSPEYVREVVSTYREAIDLIVNDQFTHNRKQMLFQRIQKVYNRGFCDGFYFGEPADGISMGPEQLYEKIYVGEVMKFYKRLSVAEVNVQAASFRQGDRLLVYGKITPAHIFLVDQIEISHKRIVHADKGKYVGIKFPFTARRGDKVFLWQPKKWSGVQERMSEQLV